MFNRIRFCWQWFLWLCKPLPEERLFPMKQNEFEPLQEPISVRLIPLPTYEEYWGTLERDARRNIFVKKHLELFGATPQERLADYKAHVKHIERTRLTLRRAFPNILAADTPPMEEIMTEEKEVVRKTEVEHTIVGDDVPANDRPTPVGGEQSQKPSPEDTGGKPRPDNGSQQRPTN